MAREVREEFLIELDLHRDLKANIPSHYFERYRRTERERISDLWERFRESVNKALRHRRCVFVDSHTRRIVFRTAMEKLCKDFSTRNENITVSFEATRNKKSSARYRLRLNRLSDVPQSWRPRGPSCTAEIPTNPEPEAVAEFVAYERAEERSANLGRRPAQAEYASLVPSAPVVPSAPIEEDVAYDSASPLSRGNLCDPPRNPFDRSVESAENPPVATPVTSSADAVADTPMATAVMDARQQRQPSALERMRELESIKTFLSQEEYLTKRRAILDSI